MSEATRRMIPIYQTRTDERENSLAACIASLIQVPLEVVDFSCADHPHDWAHVARSKLHPLGLSFVHAGIRRIGGKGYPALNTGTMLCIAHGPRVGTGMAHAIIYESRYQTHIHDPYPGGQGICYVEAVSFIVPLKLKAEVQS